MNMKILATILCMSSLAIGMESGNGSNMGKDELILASTIEAIKNGLEINQKVMARSFSIAIETNDPEAVKFLIKSGADVNSLEREATNSLIATGFDMNVIDEEHQTPLRRAILYCHPEIVKVLLSTANIIVNSNDLKYTKQRYQKKIEQRGKRIEEPANMNIISRLLNMTELFNELASSTNEKDIKKLVDIGRMIITHLGLYTGQSRISKTGVGNFGDLPPELVARIACFMHN